MEKEIKTPIFSYIILYFFLLFFLNLLYIAKNNLASLASSEVRAVWTIKIK